MKKIITALAFFGAFLFIQPVQAQEIPLDYSCPDGGIYQNHPEIGHICSVPAPYGSAWTATRTSTSATGTSSLDAYYNFLSAFDGTVIGTCYNNQTETHGTQTIRVLPPNETEISHNTGRTSAYTFSVRTERPCSVTGSLSPTTYTGVSNVPSPPAYFCPPDNDPSLTNYYDDPIAKLCWTQAILENDCPEQNGDCEPEPDPNECPPGTIGGCEPEPDCIVGGGGMSVCKADPDEKCDAYTHEGTTYYDCPAGCGFVNEDLFCLSDSNNEQDFNKCKFTFNGYACPSEPNDNIPDPEKPIEEMAKQDFKEVNHGIETRQDKTNDLLETQLQEWAQEAQKTRDADAANTAELAALLGDIDTTVDSLHGPLNELLDHEKMMAEKTELNLPPEPASYYDSAYEDGIYGIWQEHSAALMQTPMFTFLNQFKMTPSGNQPDMNLCFNFLIDLGCHALEVPDFIWAFLRLIILITAAFTCRRIIFGG